MVNNVYRSACKVPATYLLTPWCRVLLEQLTGLQLVKKFPAYHGTRRFITALTSVRHLSLSWASPIQSIYPHSTSWRSVPILSTHLRLGLPSGLFPSGFPDQAPTHPPSHTFHTCGKSAADGLSCFQCRNKHLRGQTIVITGAVDSCSTTADSRGH